MKIPRNSTSGACSLAYPSGSLKADNFAGVASAHHSHGETPNSRETSNKPYATPWASLPVIRRVSPETCNRNASLRLFSARPSWRTMMLPSFPIQTFTDNTFAMSPASIRSADFTTGSVRPVSQLTVTVCPLFNSKAPALTVNKATTMLHTIFFIHISTFYFHYSAISIFSSETPMVAEHERPTNAILRIIFVKTLLKYRKNQATLHLLSNITPSHFPHLPVTTL